jgi:hypothetical protein
VPGVVGGQREPGDRQRDDDVDGRPERAGPALLHLRQRLGQHPDEQVGDRRERRPDRVPREHAHDTERPERHGGGEHARRDDEGPARGVERPRRRLGDDDDLEGRPPQALQDVQAGRQGAGPAAEQPAQQDHRRHALAGGGRGGQAEQPAPITVPTAMARTVSRSGRPASTTKDAATGSSRLTPRLAQSRTCRAARARSGPAR